MKNNESVAAFQYRSYLPVNKDGDFTRHSGKFNVYNRRECQSFTPYRRRDFFKITLIESKGWLHYAEKVIEINQPTLLFSNPMIPYSWQAEPGEQLGYYCIFTADFLAAHSGHMAIAGLFSDPEQRPVFFLDPQQQKHISNIFQQMQVENQSDYMQKDALLYNYIQILVHEAKKLQPARKFTLQKNASARITALFLDLLDRQFPVEKTGETILLKRAADFAAHLSVHVNHLNRAIKEVTGKTTSAWIADRLIQEAQSLLTHTDWNVNEIAYSLGFEYPSYFNQVFRKQTQRTPASFRN